MTGLSKKLKEKITNIQAERDIYIPESMDAACERYVKDLRFIIDRDIKFNNPVLMLSGGVDSMMLGCILKKYFNLKHSITCGSAKDANEIMVSEDSAEKLGITQEILYVTWDEVLDNLPLIKNKDVVTPFDVIYYLVFYLCLKKTDIKNLDLIQGDGADTLLGSIQQYMYFDSRRVAEYFNISKSAAKTRLKQNWYNDYLADPQQLKRRFGGGHLFLDVCYELGANPIMAFKNPDIIRWVNDLDYDFAKPDRKLYPKEVIHYLGYDGKKLKRTVMQQGTGLYEKMKTHMMQLTGAKTPNAAVKKYMKGGGTLPGL